jgi:hypothetical protein
LPDTAPHANTTDEKQAYNQLLKILPEHVLTEECGRNLTHECLTNLFQFVRLCVLEEPSHDLPCRQHIVNNLSQEHIVLLRLGVEWRQELLIIHASALHHHVGDNGAHLHHESLRVILDVDCQDLSRNPTLVWLNSVIWIVQVIGDQLGAEVDIGHQSLWGACLVRVETKGEQGLPCVLRGLAHGALDAVIIITHHLLDIDSLVVQLAFRGHILLQAVKMECMATLVEGDTRLVRLVDNLS